MASKGKNNGALPSATVASESSDSLGTTAEATLAGNEQEQGDENAPANVPSAGTVSEALTRDDVAVLFDIQPADVLSFREYDNRIVVVTTAGAKLEAAK